MSPTLVLALCFVITLAIGVPVVWSLALSSMVACLSIPGISLSFLAQKMELGSEQYSLLAIFFFMLAGAVMQHGGIAVRLIAFADGLPAGRPVDCHHCGVHVFRGALRLLRGDDCGDRRDHVSRAGQGRL